MTEPSFLDSRNINTNNVFLSRLVEAGASGLADFLVGKVVKEYKDAVSTSSVPGTISESVKVTTLSTTSTTGTTATLDARTRHLNHINQELQPIPWSHWLVNVLLICRYINEEGGTLFLGGLDLTKLSHKIMDYLCCGSRRRQRYFPMYKRIHNSFVIWNPVQRQLIGSDGTNGEFGFIKQSALAYGALYSGVMVLLAVTTFIYKDHYLYGIHEYISESNINLMLSIYVGYILIFFLCASYLSYIAVMLVAGPIVVGSRVGSLPTLMPYLLQASAPEFFISYSWGEEGRMTSLARALGEILPNSWIDVRSLVSGQKVEGETVASAARSRVTVLLITPEYLRSRNCTGELYAAMTKRKHKGRGKYHKTIALIEKRFLQGVKPIHTPIDVDISASKVSSTSTGSISKDADNTIIEEARSLLERKGYTVVQNEPDINWHSIKTIFEESGCNVVTSVDDLLSTIQNTTIRTTGEDTAICMRWWAQYPSGINAATNQNMRLRVPWNLSGSTEQVQNKIRKFGQTFGAFIFRLFCLRRPYKYTGLFAWKEQSITTGMGGAWISFDGSSEPKPHVDFTPRATLDVVFFLTVVLFITILFVVVFGDFQTPDDTHEHLQVIINVITSIGLGTLAFFLCTFRFMVGFWTLINELFPSFLILHSSVLFPFFALAEIQNVPTLTDSDGNMEDLAKIDSDLESNSENPESRTGLSRQGRNIPDPIVSAAIEIPNVYTHKSTTHTFSIIFAHNNSKIKTSIDNMNTFLARYVFGIDSDPNNPKFPKVQSLSDLLENKEHPKPYTVYVFFLDSVESRQAWSEVGKRIDNPWRPEFVVLITDSDSLRTAGTDLVSAKHILTNILPLTTTTTTTKKDSSASNISLRSSNAIDMLTDSLINTNENSITTSITFSSDYDNRTSTAADVLRIFEALDHGKRVCINPHTVPSSPATREALRKLLQDLGYRTIPNGTEVAYQTPYNVHNPTSTPPLLLSVLGPLVAYGSGNILAKRKIADLQLKRGNHGTPSIHRSHSNENSTTLTIGGIDTDTRNRLLLSEEEGLLTPRSIAVTIPSPKIESSNAPPSIFDQSLMPNLSPKNTTSPHLEPSSPSAIKRIPLESNVPPGPVLELEASRMSPSRSVHKRSGNYERTSDRMQDHMLIVYKPEKKENSSEYIAKMPTGSPYEGLVPAILEAIALKIGPVIILSGGF